MKFEQIPQELKWHIFGFLMSYKDYPNTSLVSHDFYKQTQQVRWIYLDTLLPEEQLKLLMRFCLQIQNLIKSKESDKDSIFILDQLDRHIRNRTLALEQRALAMTALAALRMIKTDLPKEKKEQFEAELCLVLGLIEQYHQNLAYALIALIKSKRIQGDYAGFLELQKRFDWKKSFNDCEEHYISLEMREFCLELLVNEGYIRHKIISSSLFDKMSSSAIRSRLTQKQVLPMVSEAVRGLQSRGTECEEVEKRRKGVEILSLVWNILEKEQIDKILVVLFQLLQVDNEYVIKDVCLLFNKIGSQLSEKQIAIIIPKLLKSFDKIHYVFHHAGKPFAAFQGKISSVQMTQIVSKLFGWISSSAYHQFVAVQILTAVRKNLTADQISAIIPRLCSLLDGAWAADEAAKILVEFSRNLTSNEIDQIVVQSQSWLDSHEQRKKIGAVRALKAISNHLTQGHARELFPTLFNCCHNPDTSVRAIALISYIWSLIEIEQQDKVISFFSTESQYYKSRVERKKYIEFKLRSQQDKLTCVLAKIKPQLTPDQLSRAIPIWIQGFSLKDSSFTRKYCGYILLEIWDSLNINQQNQFFYFFLDYRKRKDSQVLSAIWSKLTSEQIDQFFAKLSELGSRAPSLIECLEDACENLTLEQITKAFTMLINFLGKERTNKTKGYAAKTLTAISNQLNKKQRVFMFLNSMGVLPPCETDTQNAEVENLNESVNQFTKELAEEIYPKLLLISQDQEEHPMIRSMAAQVILYFYDAIHLQPETKPDSITTKLDLNAAASSYQSLLEQLKVIGELKDSDLTIKRELAKGMIETYCQFALDPKPLRNLKDALEQANLDPALAYLAQRQPLLKTNFFTIPSLGSIHRHQWKVGQQIYNCSATWVECMKIIQHYMRAFEGQLNEIDSQYLLQTGSGWT